MDAGAGGRAGGARPFDALEDRKRPDVADVFGVDRIDGREVSDVGQEDRDGVLEQRETAGQDGRHDGDEHQHEKQPRTRANLAFVFDTGNAFLALIIAFSLNLLFAGWPAMRAAKLDPIDALRHE